MADEAIIALAIMGELLGMDSERCWYGFAKRNLSKAFGLFCDRARYNRTKRALLHMIGYMQQEIISRLPTSNIGIIDSCPLPVCRFGRAHFHKAYKGCGASYGYCASKKEQYYGYKLHLITDENGLPIAYDLTGANVDDRAVADELNAQAGKAVLIGDKGYIGLKLSLATMTALERKNAKNPQYSKEQRQLIFKKRRRIETTISQLTDSLHIQKVRAKVILGPLYKYLFENIGFLNRCLNQFFVPRR
ncbi:MAG: IS982 family transposase [Clostridiales bacterium]|jgi:transposase|nr:IS982 family transposase [Clostridiales bacterium]